MRVLAGGGAHCVRRHKCLRTAFGHWLSNMPYDRTETDLPLLERSEVGPVLLPPMRDDTGDTARPGKPQAKRPRSRKLIIGVGLLLVLVALGKPPMGALSDGASEGLSGLRAQGGGPRARRRGQLSAMS
jgi:hypothetical protein